MKLAEVQKLVVQHYCLSYTTYLVGYRRRSNRLIHLVIVVIQMTEYTLVLADSHIFVPKTQQNLAPSINVDNFQSLSYIVPWSYDRLYSRLAPKIWP